MYFPFISRKENFGELGVHFKLQVDRHSTNLAEIWPDCCQILLLQNYPFLGFKARAFFYTRSANLSVLLWLYRLIKEEQKHLFKI